MRHELARPHRTPKPEPRRRWIGRLSLTGLYFGGLWCASTFTPSLVPRDWLFQGLLSGVVLAVGYGFGAALAALWEFLELPVIPQRYRRPLYWVLIAVTVARLGWYFMQTRDWQVPARELLEMPQVDHEYYLRIIAIMLIVAGLLLLIGRLLVLGVGWAARLPKRVSQRRIASVLGIAVFAVLLVLVVNGTLVRGVITVIDNTLAAADTRDPEGAVPPTTANFSGSPDSLVPWDLLGYSGKLYMTEGHVAEEISDFTGRAALDPIRLYVGLRAGDDHEARAALALEELKRSGAFDRQILVIATPTGTGWIDDNGITPLEFMHDGDTAVVAVQYSYLSSPLSLILQPGLVQESATVVFREIYDHWASLPEDDRPELYLFGLSLGSLGSEGSITLQSLVKDRISGALWVGPPFRNPVWRSIRANRDPDSPDWQPVFEEGTVFRTLTRSNSLDDAGPDWGPVRIAYLAYPTDAIVFFQESMWYRRPDWLDEPRGPDVSPEFEWTPVVTMWQVAVDMLGAFNTPAGHGHNYRMVDYGTGWMGVTQPEDWTAEDNARLADLMNDARPKGGN